MLLLWTARITLGLLILATVLPLVPVGAWMVRLCDFPRLQIAALLLLPLSLLVWRGVQQGWTREIGILVAAGLLAGLWQTAHVIPYSPFWPKEVASNERGDSATIRMLVANVEYTNSRHAELRDVIETYSPDLLLAIEVDEKWEEALQPVAEQYAHRCGVVRGDGLGMVLWSKIPLADDQVRHLISERRASIFATLELPSGQRVRFVGVHPTPPGISDATGDERRDSRVRDAELVLVAKEVRKDENSPWIVTGDFNDVAWSHTTALFKRLSGLKDPRIGRRLLTTFHAEYPLLRYPIDHVFVSPGFQLRTLEKVRLPGSDHFGVVADVVPQRVEQVDPEVSGENLEEAEEIVEDGQQDADARDVQAREAD